MAKINLLGLTAWLTVVALLIWLIFDRRAQDKVEQEYWENPNFKTDTFKVDIDYTKIPVPEFKYSVPPATVTIYKAAEAPKVSINFNDSLITVIDSLKQHIYTINALYLKLYPDAHKLIYAEFKEDSIKLDLLSTQGVLFTQAYAVNYARFQYQYKDNLLRGNEVKTKPPSNAGLQGALYGYAGYALGLQSPVIGADYSIYKGRFRLQADSYISIQAKPTYYLAGTIGYKIHGN